MHEGDLTMERKPDSQSESGEKQPSNLLHAGYLSVQLSGFPDYKEWCIEWIYGCCLKHLSTGKKLCDSLSSVWMSTVHEIQDSQKIISISSANASKTRAARKNTMTFDVHWLSRSFSVRRKNGFLFFLFLDQKQPYLQTYPLRAASFALSSIPPDFPLILKYRRLFFSPLSVKKNICKNIWTDQKLLWALTWLTGLELNWLAFLPAESHQLFGCKHQRETVTTLFLAYLRAYFYCCLQNLKGVYIQHSNDSQNEQCDL